PTTSSLPRTRSTTELQQLDRVPPVQETLPTGERAMGIKPTTSCLEGRCSAFELRPHRATHNVERTTDESSPRPADISVFGSSAALLRPLPCGVVLDHRVGAEWVGRDSNPRRTQSARFTVWCHWPLGHLPSSPLVAFGRT